MKNFDQLEIKPDMFHGIFLILQGLAAVGSESQSLKELGLSLSRRLELELVSSVIAT